MYLFVCSFSLFCALPDCDGSDLDMYLKLKHTLSEKESKSIIMQVFSGLQYLNEQKNRIIHYDLKPGNILFQRKNDIGCLLNGTLVAMADGTSRPCEQIKKGDLLRGVDREIAVVEDVQPSLPRAVSWRIDHRGDLGVSSYIVSEEHRLTLVCGMSPRVGFVFGNLKWRLRIVYMTPTGILHADNHTVDITDEDRMEEPDEPVFSEAAELELLQREETEKELDEDASSATQASFAEAAHQKGDLLTGTRSQLLQWARNKFASIPRSRYLLLGEMFEVTPPELAANAESMGAQHGCVYAASLPRTDEQKEEELRALEESGAAAASAESLSAAAAVEKIRRPVDHLSYVTHQAAVEAALQVDRTNTLPILANIATGGGKYASIGEGDTASIVYMLHHPLDAYLPFGADSSGRKSRTLLTIERIQRAVGVQVQRGTGIVMTLLNPIASRTGKIHSTHSMYDEVCKKSITHALSYRTPRIIVFGRSARLRWIDEIAKRQITGEIICATAVRFVSGVRCIDFVVARDGRAVQVLFSPHPCQAHMDRVVARVIATAHDKEMPCSFDVGGQRRLLFAAIPAVRLVGPAFVTNIVIEGKTDADRRYVLASGVVTHNSLKITDFGLSKVMQEGSHEAIELTSQGSGTYWYLPPECFVQDPLISSAVDVWSAGIVLYQMLYGRKPFGHGMAPDALLSSRTMMEAKKVPFPDSPVISAGCKAFIERCLAFDPKNRPQILEIMKDPYFGDAKASGVKKGAAAAAAAAAAATAAAAMAAAGASSATGAFSPGFAGSAFPPSSSALGGGMGGGAGMP